MALGARIFGGLIGTNGLVRIETPTVSVTGGITTTWTTVIASVDVLITQLGGDRKSSGSDAQTDTHTVTGLETELARTDTRFYVESCPDLPDLEGQYLRVNNSVRHPAGRGRLLNSRITCHASRIQLPANQL